MRRFVSILIVVALCVIGWSGISRAVASTDQTGSVYVTTLRTSDHVRFSSAKVFREAAADVHRLLLDNKVRLAAYSEGGVAQDRAEQDISTMLAAARDAGADSLLVVTVDRPPTQWIRIILQCYDVTGRLIWVEKIGSGTSPLTGGSGYKKCFEKLQRALQSRVGGPGLPVYAAEASGRAGR